MTKQNTTKLRPATLNDVEPLATLSHKTVLEKYPSVIGKEKVEGYVASGAVPAYYHDRNQYCVVAEQDGVVVGVYATKDNTVDLMMVDLAYHRSGVGSLLLADAEKNLSEKYDKLSLESFRDNTQAVAFYKKHGWLIERHFDDLDYDIPMVQMVK
ncbi:MAG: hypothetical protein DHS20C05_18900 [Hyphococcus sp.]|nr:MAG: hypothetical protein DHS20C05_18900 [Marinicaulis sp.]